jgi:hypothetical protein
MLPDEGGGAFQLIDYSPTEGFIEFHQGKTWLSVIVIAMTDI